MSIQFIDLFSVNPTPVVEISIINPAPPITQLLPVNSLPRKNSTHPANSQTRRVKSQQESIHSVTPESKTPATPGLFHKTQKVTIIKNIFNKEAEWTHGDVLNQIYSYNSKPKTLAIAFGVSSNIRNIKFTTSRDNDNSHTAIFPGMVTKDKQIELYPHTQETVSAFVKQIEKYIWDNNIQYVLIPYFSQNKVSYTLRSVTDKKTLYKSINASGVYESINTALQEIFFNKKDEYTIYLNNNNNNAITQIIRDLDANKITVFKNTFNYYSKTTYTNTILKSEIKLRDSDSNLPDEHVKKTNQLYVSFGPKNKEDEHAFKLNIPVPHWKYNISLYNINYDTNTLEPVQYTGVQISKLFTDLDEFITINNIDFVLINYMDVDDILVKLDFYNATQQANLSFKIKEIISPDNLNNEAITKLLQELKTTKIELDKTIYNLINEAVYKTFAKNSGKYKLEYSTKEMIDKHDAYKKVIAPRRIQMFGLMEDPNTLKSNIPLTLNSKHTS